jgi:pro-apoptotic serine protease NMA111
LLSGDGFTTPKVTVFVELEEVLDAHVGKPVEVEVVRGGEHIKQTVVVQDLHSITPKSYVEFGDCVLNDLSYHNAKANHLPVGGMYVFFSPFFSPF